MPRSPSSGWFTSGAGRGAKGGSGAIKVSSEACVGDVLAGCFCAAGILRSSDGGSTAGRASGVRPAHLCGTYELLASMHALHTVPYSVDLDIST
eukprot:364759-Chlamydomonas_euryale.AAC.13